MSRWRNGVGQKAKATERYRTPPTFYLPRLITNNVGGTGSDRRVVAAVHGRRQMAARASRQPRTRINFASNIAYQTACRARATRVAKRAGVGATTRARQYLPAARRLCPSSRNAASVYQAYSAYMRGGQARHQASTGGISIQHSRDLSEGTLASPRRHCRTARGRRSSRSAWRLVRIVGISAAAAYQ